MDTPELSLSRAQELVSRITRNDDGAHAEELLELINGVADPESLVGQEVKKQLYMMTPDFEQHFRSFVLTGAEILASVNP